MIIPVYN